MSGAALRTPEERFEGLPDFDFEPHYREAGGLRLAHIDSGEGAPVVFFHGEPTWSFLWRKVIPPVRDAGFRCIAPDLGRGAVRRRDQRGCPGQDRERLPFPPGGRGGEDRRGLIADWLAG